MSKKNILKTSKKIPKISIKLNNDFSEIINDDDDYKLITAKKITSNELIDKINTIKSKKYSEYKQITCPLCGKIYNITNGTHHKKTREHMAYENINNKLLNLLFLKND